MGNKLPPPHQRATVPAMSSVRIECRLRIERHIRENAQDLPRAERGLFFAIMLRRNIDHDGRIQPLRPNQQSTDDP
jgi:hypothetical protein